MKMLKKLGLVACLAAMACLFFACKEPDLPPVEKTAVGTYTATVNDGTLKMVFYDDNTFVYTEDFGDVHGEASGTYAASAAKAIEAGDYTLTVTKVEGTMTCATDLKVNDTWKVAVSDSGMTIDGVDEVVFKDPSAPPSSGGNDQGGDNQGGGDQGGGDQEDPPGTVYTITYELPAGVYNNGDNSFEYTGESAVTLYEAFKLGYLFDAWYDTPECDGEPVSEIPQGSKGNKTFYPKFKEEEYLVVTTDTVMLIPDGFQGMTLGATENWIPEGFDGWIKVMRGSDVSDEDLEYTEKWTLNMVKNKIGKDDNAFGVKLDLSELTTLTEIHDEEFKSYYGLIGIKLPNTITSIGKNAFAWSNVAEVEMHEGLEEICDRAFYQCRLTAVTIPEGVNRVGEEAFYRCPLKDVTISYGVKEIAWHAFYCISITNMTFDKLTKTDDISRPAPDYKLFNKDGSPYLYGVSSKTNSAVLWNKWPGEVGPLMSDNGLPAPHTRKGEWSDLVLRWEGPEE